MQPMEIAAQVIGIAAMSMNVLSYQQKNPRMVILFQFFGSALFVANYLMLGAVVGAILNLLGVFRAIVFINKERFQSDRPIWLVIFGALFLSSYILAFTAFGKEPSVRNLVLELLPVIGMMITTVSFQKKDAKTIRRLALINSPFWLTYNLVTFTIGGILAELFGLTSILIGMFRFDRKKSKQTTKV